MTCDVFQTKNHHSGIFWGCDKTKKWNFNRQICKKFLPLVSTTVIMWQSESPFRVYNWKSYQVNSWHPLINWYLLMQLAFLCYSTRAPHESIFKYQIWKRETWVVFGHSREVPHFSLACHCLRRRTFAAWEGLWMFGAPIIGFLVYKGLLWTIREHP